MAAKPKKIEFTTPRVRLDWPKLVEADFGSKEHPVPNGRYTTKAIFDTTDAAVQEFLAKLQPFHDDAVKRAREEFKGLKAEVRKKLGDITENAPFTELLDQETEEPTGEVSMSFKRSFKIDVKKGPRAGKTIYLSVPLFDGLGRPIIIPRDDQGRPKRKFEIWGGSVARVTFSLKTDKDGNIGYFIPGTGACGISFELEAVQILELAQGGGRNASAYGFGAEEGAFSADEFKAEQDADATGTGEQDADAAAGTPDF